MIYVIGDVHGEYETLMRLLDKLYEVTDIIFVGDLIDRGSDSSKIISFVRENNYKVVLGNHEDMMIKYGKKILDYYPDNFYLSMLDPWFRNGGIKTLLSYNILKYDNNRLVYFSEDDNIDTNLSIFENDIKYLSTLPLYLETDFLIRNKKVVISHASIDFCWDHRFDIDFEKKFKKEILWNRDIPSINTKIFNIFGHTIIDSVCTDLHYINLDTGAHFNPNVFPSLTAYCLDTGEIFSQHKVVK